MVGRDRSGDSNAHGGTLSAGRHLNGARSGYPVATRTAAAPGTTMTALHSEAEHKPRPGARAPGAGPRQQPSPLAELTRRRDEGGCPPWDHPPVTAKRTP